MAIWITFNKEFDVEQLQSNKVLNIVRMDTELNSFRFGFASMNEEELRLAVNEISDILIKY